MRTQSVRLLMGLVLALGLLAAPVRAAPEASNQVSLIAQLGGETRAVATGIGNKLYIGIGPRLMVFNVNQTTGALSFLGQSEPLPGVIKGLKIFSIPGKYNAYVATGAGGLQILDLSTDTALTVLGSYDTVGDASDVDVVLSPANAQPYAFIADGPNGLVALNVNNDAAPTLVPAMSLPATTSWAQGVAAGSVDGKTSVYIAFGDEGLRLWQPFEVTPLEPVLPFDPGNWFEDVALADGYAYAADMTLGKLRIIPAGTLAEAGSLSVANGLINAVSLNAAATRAYVVGNGTPNGSLWVIDVSVKDTPALVGLPQELPAVGEAVTVNATGTFAYVADGPYGLRVINLATEATLSTYGAPGKPTDLALSGNYAYVADGAAGLRVLNVSTPLTPTVAGSYQPPFITDTVEFSGIAISGAYAYVADAVYGLRVFTITTPSAPALAGSYSGAIATGLDVAVSGSTAYVAAGGNGLRVLDVSNLAAMSELGAYTTTLTSADCVTVVGTTAYVGQGASGGVSLLNVSNPASLTQLGVTPVITEAYDVAVSGALAYVAAGDAGLVIFNVSNPAAPALIGTLDTPGAAYGVALVGSYYALISDYANGLRVVDVHTPSAPVEVGFYETAGRAYRSAINGYIHTADTEGGYWIFDALSSDLAISKTDGRDVISAVPATVVYTVTVSNLGAHHVAGATVTDTVPTLTGVTWSCAASAGSTCPASGSGNTLNANVDLLSGGTATFLITGTLNSAASLVNTAYVSAAPGLDTNAANNSATDATADATTDLGVTMTRTGSGIPGTPLTYTLTITNSGPTVVVGAVVSDIVPAALTNVTWTCAANAGAHCHAASGAGNTINTSVDVTPTTGSATLTIEGVLDSNASGALNNTASVTAPLSTFDSNTSNNTAFNSVTLVPTVNLLVSKTHAGTLVPGAPLTYTIVVTNSGPSQANAVSITDTIPASVQNPSWTCTPFVGGSECGMAGPVAGPVSTLITLPVNGKATIVVAGTLAANAAPGATVLNTAYAAVPVGVTNIGQANASDSFLVANAQTDLSISVTDGQTGALPGASLTYTIVAQNVGPSDATNATVTDNFPAELSSITWTCAGAGGAVCPASGSGNLNATTVSLPVGTALTFTVNATVLPTASGTVTNTASIAAGGSATDPVSGNNSSTDTTSLDSTDLGLILTHSGSGVPGTTITYTVVVTNAGPKASQATVTDNFPSAITGVTWTCTAASGASCVSGGSGHLSTPVTLPVGGQVTFVAVGLLSPAQTADVSNTASVTPTGGLGDHVSANDSDTDLLDVLALEADLVLTQSAAAATAQPGTVMTFTFAFTNTGPSRATNLSFSDALPSGVAYLSAMPSQGGCGYNAGTVTCNLGALDPNASLTLTLEVTVTANSAMTITNSGTVIASADSILSNNTAQAAFDVVIPNYPLFLPLVVR